MNYKMVAFVLGRIFCIEAVLMLFPMLCAACYGEWYLLPAFLLPAVLLAVLGLAASLRTPKNTTIFARDGLAIVALVWVLMSAFGALPFVISGEIPSFIDAFFETVSGFTTTGSTILTDVEALSHGTLFWRSFAHWVGGMGVLVLAMAVLPMTDGRAMHLMRAEVPGPTVGKISSKLSDSAKILYAIYFAMTLAEVILLCAGGMPLFDSLIHAFGTAGTGGFSNKGLSVGAYNNPYFEIVIGVFMLLFGINFNLYYFLLLRRFRDAFCSEEMLTYLGIVAFSTVTITLNILHLYDGVGTALRTAFFQVSSIITTTGYASADFNLWPTYARTVICILTFIGACAGSTAGGLKISRIVIFFKAAKQDLNKMLHTHAVTTVRFEGKPLDEKVLRGVHNYFNIYMLLLAVSILLISLDGFDLVTTFTSVLTCINNVGPGLEVVGPMGNFAGFSAPAKLLLSFDMLAGRLELYPMLALFSPRLWQKRISSFKEARA
ncbi:MAG: TrkH family potassium uptake protein [Subdoligranulum variabile]|uniref:TrkH family potassium uptake protein n=1 Tax=Gemmiger sp. TaxID=2049027 RepID=UPI002A91C60B|nr:TrkH family potassium uptake protein [Gemmiger sp.]MDD7639809.1 TrkH family potassium uptake protein [Subdoligranulum variabile]MDY5411251.1 TrkH family potassium uptake protein [Gemmiger sp.]MDY5604780.1 TrkH family potassium uptake protein [Gemmiger sp.]